MTVHIFCCLQKIARRVLPQGLEQTGEITIVCRPWTEVHSTYAISPVDGRMCVSGWKEFMAQINFLKKGDKTLMLL
jgi:hypothetical protein